MKNQSMYEILLLRIKVCVLCFTCLIINNVKAQTPQFDWVQNSNTSYFSEASSIDVDNHKNVFYAGYFRSLIDLDTGTNNVSCVPPFLADYAIYIAKLDSNKNFVWGKFLTNSYYLLLEKIKLDAQGNILILGYNYGYQADFDPGPDIVNLDYGMFLLKLDTAGNFIWIKSLPQSNSFIGSSDMEVDNMDNIIISSFFNGTFDFDSDTAVYNLSASSYENYILKLGSNGNFLWVEKFGNTSSQATNNIAIDNNGNILSCARFDSSFDINPDTSVYIITGSGYYILKLDSSGNFIWAKQFSNVTPNEIVTGINRDIYYTGSFTGTVDFNPDSGTTNHTSSGNSDIFISKLSENGNFIWVKTYGGSGFNRGTDLALDTLENIYFTGNFYGISNFGNITNPNFLNSNGNSEIFVSKLNSQGNEIWARSIGSTGIDYVRDIHLKQDNLYLAGSFTDTVDFDFGTNYHNVQSYAATSELFVLKLNLSLHLTNDTVTICQGDSLLLNSGYSVGNLWNTGDTSQFINVATNGQYYVSINNGSIVSDTITVIVIPGYPLFTSLILAASDTLICSGSEAQITASINVVNNQTNYLWSVNGIISNSSDSVISVAVDSTTNIFAYINSSGVCNTQFITSANSVTINTFPSTEVIFNSPQANTWICTNEPAFQITGGSPIGGVYSGSGVSNGIFTPGVNLPNINVINYTYQDSNFCTTQAIDTFLVDVCTDISSINNITNLQVFPIPAKDNIYINVSDDINTYYSIITDITGKILLKEILTNNINEINISILSNGMYFIIVNNGNKQSILKFIKE